MATGKPSEAKTTIDSLVELLHDKGKMELGKIVEILGVDPNIVENWARVLEENNIVRVTYEVGKMYIEPITVSKEEAQAAIATTEAKSASLETEVAMQRASLERYAARLDSLSTSVKTAEKLFQTKFPDFERQLEGINKIYSALEAESAAIDTIRKKADTTYEDINRKVSGLYGKIEGVDINTAQTAKEQLTRIETTLKRAYELEGQLDLLSRSKDKTLDAIRKSIEEQLHSLERDLDKAERNIDSQLKIYKSAITKDVNSIRDQERLIDQLTKQINNFRREKEAVKKSLSTSKTLFNDEYAKVSARMDTTSGALHSQIDVMVKELDSLKSNFGDIVKIFDDVQKIRKEVEEAQKKIAELRSESERIMDEARSLQTKRGTAESKTAAMRSIEEKKAAMDLKRAKIEDDVDKIGKELGEAQK